MNARDVMFWQLIKIIKVGEVGDLLRQPRNIMTQRELDKEKHFNTIWNYNSKSSLTRL